MKSLEQIKLDAYRKRILKFQKLQETKIIRDSCKSNAYLSEYNKRIEKQHKETSNKYTRNRRKTDINFKIRCNLASRVKSALKGNTKSASTMKLIGCSIEFARKHLESQFTEGMSWDNHGSGNHGKGMKEWHIDHIQPCALFDLSKPEEQRKCFHYTNLQPLWATHNLIKSDNI